MLNPGQGYPSNNHNRNCVRWGYPEVRPTNAHYLDLRSKPSSRVHAQAWAYQPTAATVIAAYVGVLRKNPPMITGQLPWPEARSLGYPEGWQTTAHYLDLQAKPSTRADACGIQYPIIPPDHAERLFFFWA